MASLDVVNAVAYLAYFSEEVALGLDFRTEKMYER